MKRLLLILISLLITLTLQAQEKHLEVGTLTTVTSSTIETNVYANSVTSHREFALYVQPFGYHKGSFGSWYVNYDTHRFIALDTSFDWYSKDHTVDGFVGPRLWKNIKIKNLEGMIYARSRVGFVDANASFDFSPVVELYPFKGKAIVRLEYGNTYLKSDFTNRFVIYLGRRF